MVDEALEHQIVVALRRIIRAIDRHSRHLAETFGLTAPQILVLRVLSTSGSLATGELARRVHLAQGTVSEILDRLNELGLVDRKRSTTDKRRVDCNVTEKALEILKRSPPLLQERFAGELRKLSEWERSFLLAALQRVAAMMHAEEIDASPFLVSGPAAATAEKTADFLQDGES